MLILVIALIAALASSPTTSPSPASGEHSFTITNHTQQAILSVVIEPSASNAWGSDLLGEDEVLSPGASRAFLITTGCLEDILITWVDHHSRSWYGFDTCRYDMAIDHG